MASYSIPEEITGIPLFVPDAYDYFSIDTAGMPNGDDCLIIHGNTSTDYKAFQKAQVLTPNVFLGRADSWGMSFWFKGADATSVTNTNAVSNLLMGVQTSTGPNAYSSINDYYWQIGVSGTNLIQVLMNSGGGNASTTLPRDNVWHLVVVNVTGGTTAGMTVMVDKIASTSSQAKAGTPGTANMYFSIGAYGNHANSKGYNKEWRLGKLAFHDHILNQTERALLYDMVML